MSESAHLVQDAAKRPNIRLLVVWLLLADLWRQVVRRTNGCLSAIIGVLEDPSDTEVSNLDLSTLRHEDVLCFQVSMEDLAVMYVLDGKGHLYKPVKDLVFSVTHYSKVTKMVSVPVSRTWLLGHLPLPIFF